MRRTLLPPLLLLALALPLSAQAPPCPQLEDPQIDRVVAVVGDSIVLFTELQQECMLIREAGGDLSADEILDNLIDLQVLLQHAARDSTAIPTEADVNQRADQEIERIRTGYPSEAAFEQALAQEGLTLTALRDRIRTQIRTAMTRETFTRRRLQSAAPVSVSDAEMRAFFEERRSELQQRPEMLTVQQVLIRSGASDEAWARARQKADSLHALVLRGADFATLAREHSADPGSAQQGGDLGWVPRGMMVGEFERAAFSLMDGAVSPPVRTVYGYHVILSERSRLGAEKRLRHILIEPDAEAADLERSRDLGEEIARRIRSGESALTLAQTYGDPQLPREFAVPRGEEAPGIPEAFIQRLAQAAEGDLIGPFDVNLGGFAYVAVLHVTEVREAGDFTYEDVRETIREILRQQKQQERLYQDLRERTYVEIRL
jgi:peptidyl-prolyl cis-trans isomerase SurA